MPLDCLFVRGRDSLMKIKTIEVFRAETREGRWLLDFVNLYVYNPPAGQETCEEVACPHISKAVQKGMGEVKAYRLRIDCQPSTPMDGGERWREVIVSDGTWNIRARAEVNGLHIDEGWVCPRNIKI